MQYFTAFY